MELRARSSCFRPFHKLDPPLPSPTPFQPEQPPGETFTVLISNPGFSLMSSFLFLCNIRRLKCERSSALTVSRTHGQQQPRGRDLKLENAAPPLRAGQSEESLQPPGEALCPSFLVSSHSSWAEALLFAVPARCATSCTRFGLNTVTWDAFKGPRRGPHHGFL